MTIHRVGGWILAGAVAMGTGAVGAQTAGSVIPDAQVESNVLRALAGAAELSAQNIQTATVYGVVTLSGNVHDESMRSKAENLVARTQGVKKVVDQLTLGDMPAVAAGAQPDPSQGNVAQGQGQPGQVLMSDGTYGTPEQAQGGTDSAPPPPGYSPNPNQSADQAGNQPQGPPAQGPPSGRQPMYNRNGPPQGGRNQGVPGGQQAGIPVTVPVGAVLRVRINRGLDSNHIQPGAAFDGTVLSDVIAGGAVAIPRGATVQGTVVDAKKAGVFKGQGELGLQLNSLTLGGQVYPLQTEVWQRDGRNKTAGTVNNTAGTAVFGALIGALAGGGEGAAIGAGVGAGAGLAGSAASPRGQVIIPPESVLTFATAQPAPVRTVSEAEMQRLSYAAGPGAPPQGRPMRRYYSPYYGYYYRPVY